MTPEQPTVAEPDGFRAAEGETTMAGSETQEIVPERKVSFSLAGCGFLGIYHIGAAACLCEHVPHLLEDAKMCGASAGALIACCLICKVPMDQCVDFTLRLARSSSQYPLKGWEPTINIDAILRSTIEQVLPEDAHKVCTDRLFISVTKLQGLKNRIISKFRTRKELIDTLLCSAYVPGFSSYSIPKIGCDYVLDGGLSDNLPIIDAETITICPWAGEHSICPQDPTGQTFPLTVMNMSMSPSTSNLARFRDAFFSPRPETLKDYCWQGYDDALRFLHENHLIHCKTHRVLAVLTNLEHRMCTDCVECEHHRAHTRSSQLSSYIVEKWDVCTMEKAWKMTSLIVEPIKKYFSIWLIPAAILRDWVLKLFSLAYFQMDKFRKGGLSAEVLKFVKQLYNPRQLLWECFVMTLTHFFLRGAEFWARLLSEVMSLTSSVRRTKMALCNEMCYKCGQSYSMPAGPIKKLEAIREEQGEEEAAPAGGGEASVSKVVVLSSKEEEAVPALAEKEKKTKVGAKRKSDGPVVKVEKPAGSDLLPSQGPDSMAVWVDIHADSVELDLPLPPEEDEEGAVRPQTPETVHVKGIGEIKNVNIRPVMVPTPQEPQADGRAETAEVVQKKSETNKLHHYVQEFEQLKNIMTLHYVDENQRQRTEKLFVEDMGAETISEESLLTGPSEDAIAAVAEELMEQASKELGAEGGDAREEGQEKHDLHREVTQLIEKKLFTGRTGQRQFQKDYEANHQLRLKRVQRHEVKADIGHYSLQLIRFGAKSPPPPPSPADLSRSSSMLSFNKEEEQSRVRSVSDACTLADRIHGLRKRQKEGLAAKSPLCASHSGLPFDHPLGAWHDDLEAWGYSPLSLSQSSLLASSSQFPSLQSLPHTSHHHPQLVKSMSDISEVASNLQRLKSWRASLSEHTDHRASGWGRRQSHNVATAPLLASAAKKVAALAAEQDCMSAASSSSGAHAALPVIPDDPDRSQSPTDTK